MQKISTSLRESQLEDIHERVEGEEPNPDEGEYESRAEALRELLDKGLEHDDTVADLERDIQHLEARNDELTNQLQHERDRQEEHTELVEYVEEERVKRKEKEYANALTRAKWWLFGREDEDSDDS